MLVQLLEIPISVGLWEHSISWWNPWWTSNKNMNQIGFWSHSGFVCDWQSLVSTRLVTAGNVGIICGCWMQRAHLGMCTEPSAHHQTGEYCHPLAAESFKKDRKAGQAGRMGGKREWEKQKEQQGRGGGAPKSSRYSQRDCGHGGPVLEQKTMRRKERQTETAASWPQPLHFLLPHQGDRVRSIARKKQERCVWGERVKQRIEVSLEVKLSLTKEGESIFFP